MSEGGGAVAGEPAAGADDRKGPFASRLVWAVSLPILFAEIGEALIHATDTALLARVGTTELGAIGLADVMREVWIVPVLGFTEAGQIVMARRFGARADSAIGATFTRTFLLALGAGVALAVALAFAASWVSDQLVSSPQVGEALESFLRIAAIGLPFQALSLAYSALYVSVGRTRVLVGATVVLAGVNLVVSYLLVFGELGLPRLGIEGAAIGYVAAEACTVLFLTIDCLRRAELRRFRPFRLRAPGVARARSLARLSWPVGLEGFVETARWFVFFIVLEQAGEQALAWSNVVYACFALLVIPTDAFSETGYSLVSRALGEGRADRVRSVVRRTMLPAALVTLPFAAALFAFPEPLLTLFTDDPAAVEGSAAAVRVVAGAMLVVIPAEMWLAAVFGTGGTDAALAIEVVSSAVMLAGAYLATVVLDLPLEYAWASVAAASLIALPLAIAWVRSGRWREREV